MCWVDRQLSPADDNGTGNTDFSREEVHGFLMADVGDGPSGRITKEDVEAAHLASRRFPSNRPNGTHSVAQGKRSATLGCFHKQELKPQRGLLGATAKGVIAGLQHE